MKKRLGVLLIAALVLIQGMGVFAAGSKLAYVAVAGDSVGRYGVRETFDYDLDPAVLALINEINAGTKPLQSVGDVEPGLKDVLADKSMLTPIFDLYPINGGLKTSDGKYRVTLSVPTLTGNTADIRILYYNVAKGQWEVLTPVSVDLINKEITIDFEYLPSPVAIIAKTGTGATDTVVGTSPKTGVASNWAVWLGAAVVLMAGSAAAFKKARV